MVDFALYLITDRKQTAGRELPAVVADALSGGVTAVQLREKDLPDRELFNLAGIMRRLTGEHGARLFINGRADIAMAVGADGVHLGAAALPVAEVRRLAGPGLLIGYSAHSPAEALGAERDGADFVTFGPVFPTPSKISYGSPAGLGMLAETAALLSVPVFALGGITREHVAEVMHTGAGGIALISAVIGSTHPADAARDLIARIGTAGHDRPHISHTP